MRWYRLKIGKKGKQFSMEAQKSLPPRKENPTPLNIHLNITVNADLNAQVGSVLKIYNVDQNTFVNLRKMVGEPIHLEAGFDEGSPMCRELGYTPVIDKTIILGRVQAVIGNFQSNDPWVAISCGPYATSENQKTSITDLYKEVGSSPAQTGVVNTQIDSMSTSSLKDVLSKAFMTFLDTSWKILSSTTVANLTLTGNSQNLFTSINTLAQLISFAKNKWNIRTCLDYTNNTCILYNAGDSSLLGGDFNSYADMAGASKTPPKILKPTEFLEQPQALGLYSVSAVVILRPDLHLGDLVLLAGVIPQMNSFSGMDSFISKGVNDNLKLFSPGLYMIKGIQHNGEFYGTSPTSWSTQLELVLVTPEITSKAALNLGAQPQKSKGI